MYGAGFTDTYEDELYKEIPSGEGSASDAIDSDTEEKILSHIYYQSSVSTPKPVTAAVPVLQLKSPLSRTEADVSDSSESKYQIEKKRRKVSGIADFANASKPTSADDESYDGECSESGDQSISVTVVRPFRSATLSDEENGAAVDMHDVSFNTHDDMAVDSYLDSVTSTGLVTPVRHPDEGALMEQHHIQIDTLQLTSPAAMTHTVLIRHAADADDDDEYGYLDEAEIQGRNRYFMEEKEIICRKCYRPGHIAKDCTTLMCTVCGNDGHTSKDCKLTGNVCHACNMRGHIASECPQRTHSGSSQQRSRGCDRCSSRTHHTEECATIWRRYVYAGSRPPQYSDVTAWCYNCAARGHFGDDCQMPRAKGSLAYQGETAFGSVNCPGKMIHVSESHQQRSSHYDSSGSSRQYSSPAGHRNREGRRRENGYGPRRSHDSSHGGSRSRHHQSSSGGSASRRPPSKDSSHGKSNWNNHSSGGYHHTSSSGAVRGQHRRY
ncbi:hypothetical protein GGI20_003968 [Coemansia sp. BCRC 34301]|nr:hypothetical protein GGI20_003968 [Coemansia sp. BCRC 34301]